MRQSAWVVLLALVTVSGAAQAATSVDVQPTGGRHSLGDWLAVRGRYETRSWDLDLQNVAPASEAIGESLDEMRFKADTSSFGAELLFSVGSHLELRGILAASEIEFEGRRAKVRLDLDTDVELLYGFGARIRVPAPWPRGWDLDVDFEMLTGSFDEPDFYFTGGGPLESATEVELDWRQISVSPTLSKTFGFLTPYAGLRFATADADVNTLVKKKAETLSFESEDLLSIVLGAQFRLGSLISGDVRIDLLNNEGVVVSIVVRF